MSHNNYRLHRHDQNHNHHHHHHRHRHYGAHRNRVITPTTNEYTVVFPFEYSMRGFSASSYFASQTDNRASDAEIKNIIGEISSIHMPFATKTNFIGILLFLFFFAGFGLIFYINFTSTIGIRPELSFGIFVSIILFIIAMSIYMRKLASDSRLLVQKHLEPINTEFHQRGLRWVLPTHYPKWIELNKDYKSQETVQAVPVYAIPVAVPVVYATPPGSFQPGSQSVYQPGPQQEVQLVDAANYNRSSYEQQQ